MMEQARERHGPRPAAGAGWLAAGGSRVPASLRIQLLALALGVTFLAALAWSGSRAAPPPLPNPWLGWRLKLEERLARAPGDWDTRLALARAHFLEGLHRAQGAYAHVGPAAGSPETGRPSALRRRRGPSRCCPGGPRSAPGS